MAWVISTAAWARSLGDVIFIYRSLSAQVLLTRTTAMEPKSGEIACLSKIRWS
jgi:hypothetical protein